MGRKTRNPCLRLLRRLCERDGILPKSYHLPGVNLCGKNPHTNGRYADIWKGGVNGSPVRVKAFRFQFQSDKEKIKQVCDRVRPESAHRLITISGSILKSCSGSTSNTRTWCPCPEFRKPLIRSPSSALGTKTEIYSSTSATMGGSIGYNWSAISQDLHAQTSEPFVVAHTSRARPGTSALDQDRARKYLSSKF